MHLLRDVMHRPGSIPHAQAFRDFAVPSLTLLMAMVTRGSRGGGEDAAFDEGSREEGNAACRKYVLHWIMNFSFGSGSEASGHLLLKFYPSAASSSGFASLSRCLRRSKIAQQEPEFESEMR